MLITHSHLYIILWVNVHFLRGEKYYLPQSKVLRGKIFFGEKKKKTFTRVALKFSSNVHNIKVTISREISQDINTIMELSRSNIFLALSLVSRHLRSDKSVHWVVEGWKNRMPRDIFIPINFHKKEEKRKRLKVIKE